MSKVTFARDTITFGTRTSGILNFTSTFYFEPIYLATGEDLKGNIASEFIGQTERFVNGVCSLHDKLVHLNGVFPFNICGFVATTVELNMDIILREKSGGG